MKPKYPWATIEVGESFLIAGVKNATARGAASAASKRLGKKFATSKEADGVRVTRVA